MTQVLNLSLRGKKKELSPFRENLPYVPIQLNERRILLKTLTILKEYDLVIFDYSISLVCWLVSAPSII